jgi:hypothetical protein
MILLFLIVIYILIFYLKKFTIVRNHSFLKFFFYLWKIFNQSNLFCRMEEEKNDENIIINENEIKEELNKEEIQLNEEIIIDEENGEKEYEYYNIITDIYEKIMNKIIDNIKLDCLNTLKGNFITRMKILKEIIHQNYYFLKLSNIKNHLNNQRNKFILKIFINVIVVLIMLIISFILIFIKFESFFFFNLNRNL